MYNVTPRDRARTGHQDHAYASQRSRQLSDMDMAAKIRVRVRIYESGKMSTRGTLPTISPTLKKQLAIASVGVAATALILLFIVRQKWPSPASRFAPAASKDIKRQLASGGVYYI